MHLVFFSIFLIPASAQYTKYPVRCSTTLFTFPSLFSPLSSSRSFLCPCPLFLFPDPRVATYYLHLSHYLSRVLPLPRPLFYTFHGPSLRSSATINMTQRCYAVISLSLLLFYRSRALPYVSYTPSESLRLLPTNHDESPPLFYINPSLPPLPL